MIKKQHIRLVSQQLKSTSLKELAKALTAKLNRKVWRSKTSKPLQRNLQYGDCKDKIYQYQWFEKHGLPTLIYTTSKEIAQSWNADGITVFARLLTRSSEGKGIVVVEPGDQLPFAPVYTQYKKKKKEYRVHVFKGQVVHVLEKRKKSSTESFSKVRNLANGYVFCSDGVNEPPGLRELAIKASLVTSSDFAGVDVGYNEKKDELFLIEVNSCPGIQGSNIQRYVDAITQG